MITSIKGANLNPKIKKPISSLNLKFDLAKIYPAGIPIIKETSTAPPDIITLFNIGSKKLILIVP